MTEGVSQCLTVKSFHYKFPDVSLQVTEGVFLRLEGSSVYGENQHCLVVGGGWEAGVQNCASAPELSFSTSQLLQRNDPTYRRGESARNKLSGGAQKREIRMKKVELKRKNVGVRMKGSGETPTQNPEP